jgi:hypothetical protein
MKKIYTLFCLSLFSTAMAQYENAEVAPSLNNEALNGSKALWDVQFSFDATAASNLSTGMAGVAYYDTKFWVSKWASDSIFTFNTSGALISKFLIPGVTGTRAITTDGTNLYFATASNTISIINPVTLTVSGTITSAASEASRFLSYDATLDGGNGGFWTGNFNTNIFAISMSGTLLSTIAAATHTLTGMYGAAVDNSTSGGPYLWVYHQGGTNNSQLTAIQLATGLPTAMTHDVFTDISTLYSSTSGLAGGAFFTSDLYPGLNSIIVLTQSDPGNILVVYETDNSSSVVSLSTNQIFMYPNPSQTTVGVHFGVAVPEGTTIEVVDLKGALLHSAAVEAGSTSIDLDISALTTGTYLLKTTINSEEQILRLLKE